MTELCEENLTFLLSEKINAQIQNNICCFIIIIIISYFKIIIIISYFNMLSHFVFSVLVPSKTVSKISPVCLVVFALITINFVSGTLHY